MRHLPVPVLVLLVVLVLPAIAEAAFCHGKPAPGTRVNANPIADAQLELVREVPNGKLYMAGPAAHRFPVIHVFGSAYDMGRAQGELIPDYVANFVNQTFDYLISQIVDDWPTDFFSPQIKDLIVEFGMAYALDWNANITAPFTSKAFYDEMRGVADGSGVDYQTLLRLNMFPEITKASCSFVGAWGSATSDGKTLQVRALDFDTDGSFRDFPLVTVYHPLAGHGHAFASLGWPGQVGSLSGMSSVQMAISEIGVSFPDDSFGQGTPDTPPEIVDGKPWMFVLRDVLQYANTLTQALDSIRDSNRTCNLIIGVGDGKPQPPNHNRNHNQQLELPSSADSTASAASSASLTGAVSGIEYGGRVFRPYRDYDLLPVNASWHPPIPDVVYNGMDWLCPGYTGPLGEQLAEYHGALSPENLIKNVLITVETGNLHVAVYDLTEQAMYVSFARNSTDPLTQPKNAFERQYTKLDMALLFAEQPPSAVDSMAAATAN